MSNRRAQDERIEGTPDGSNAITEIVDVPDAPTIGTATSGFLSASVAFTPATTGGTPTLYTATSTPGSITGTSATSPITVSGLGGGTPYTFTVRGSNSTGTGRESSSSNSVTPGDLTNGYDALATVTLSSAASSITFSGIPTGYSHLQVRLSLKGSLTDAGIDVFTTINGDTTGSNYSSHYLGTSGNGGTFQGYNANRYFGAMPGTNSTSVFSAVVMDFLDYSSTNKNKTGRCIYGYDMNGSGFVTLQSIAWLNTSAITSLTFTSATGGNFQQYSQASLYGVK